MQGAPEEIRYIATKIDESTDRLSQRISCYRDIMDTSGDYHKPLFILHGEGHKHVDTQAHFISLLHKVRQNFSKAGEICVGFEIPHTRNSFGTNKLLKYFKRRPPFQAPYAHICVAQHLRHMPNIDVHFMDASRDAEELNPLDSATAKSIEQLGYSENKHDLFHLSLESNDSIHIRNHFMHRSITKKAQTCGARIVLLCVGNGHIAGCKQRNRPYDQSLSYLFESANQDVIAAIPGCYSNIVQDIPLHQKHIFLRDHFSKTAAYKASDPEYAKRQKADFDTLASEKSYVGYLLAHMGLKPKPGN